LKLIKCYILIIVMLLLESFPPLIKCVKKIAVWSVKKENLFERSELFSFSGIQRFLAILSAAAAFFAHFFLLKKKSKSQPGLRAIHLTEI